ncbi:MAG: NAD-dependent epimerase/dehydratase family protein [Iamia sp.]
MGSDPLRDPSETSDTSSTVVVTGVEGVLGRRVVALLGDAPGGIEVVPLEGDALLSDDLKRRCDGADVIVHLASVFGSATEDDPEVDRADDVTAAQRVLEAAGDAGVDHLVLLSSATVYGAWANNPMPLTEEATLRPGPDLAFAVQRAEIERRLAEWRLGHPSATATVLRPAAVVGDDGDGGWLARALHEARRVADVEGDPPAQFLHVDDLASAVVLAVTARLDGARNVAPDGWLRGAEYTALDAGTPKVRLPERVGDRVSRLRWRLGLAPTPPGLQPYARHPWVVANDRLRADGWAPEHSNEEAFVDGTPATALATLSPQRRQELALGVSGGVLAAGIGASVWAVLRRRARR